MKRKVLFAIPVLLLLLGLLGPAIYAQKTGKSNAPPVAAGQAEAPTPGGNYSPGSADGGAVAGAGASARLSSETSQDGVTGKEGEGLIGAGSGAASEKESQPLSPAPVSEAVTVNIAVVGESGEKFFGPAAVRVNKNNSWGVTALGALDATGIPYEISARWPGFVEAIAGRRNKGQSGWMYEVNGEIPLVAADKKTVTTGDKVIWWYSRSMDTPTPNWDGLVRNN